MFFSYIFQTILGPQSNFYEKLAKDCVDAGVSIDMFMFPNAYIDLATIGSAASMTGGQIFRYSYFKVSFICVRERVVCCLTYYGFRPVRN